MSFQRSGSYRLGNSTSGRSSYGGTSGASAYSATGSGYSGTAGTYSSGYGANISSGRSLSYTAEGSRSTDYAAKGLSSLDRSYSYREPRSSSTVTHGAIDRNSSMDRYSSRASGYNSDLGSTLSSTYDRGGYTSSRYGSSYASGRESSVDRPYTSYSTRSRESSAEPAYTGKYSSIRAGSSDRDIKPSLYASRSIERTGSLRDRSDSRPAVPQSRDSSSARPAEYPLRKTETASKYGDYLSAPAPYTPPRSSYSRIPAPSDTDSLSPRSPTIYKPITQTVRNRRNSFTSDEGDVSDSVKSAEIRKMSADNERDKQSHRRTLANQLNHKDFISDKRKPSDLTKSNLIVPSTAANSQSSWRSRIYGDSNAEQEAKIARSTRMRQPPSAVQETMRTSMEVQKATLQNQESPSAKTPAHQRRVRKEAGTTSDAPKERVRRHTRRRKPYNESSSSSSGEDEEPHSGSLFIKASRPSAYQLSDAEEKENKISITKRSSSHETLLTNGTELSTPHTLVSTPNTVVSSVHENTVVSSVNENKAQSSDGPQPQPRRSLVTRLEPLATLVNESSLKIVEKSIEKVKAWQQSLEVVSVQPDNPSLSQDRDIATKTPVKSRSSSFELIDEPETAKLRSASFEGLDSQSKSSGELLDGGSRVGKRKLRRKRSKEDLLSQDGSDSSRRRSKDKIQNKDFRKSPLNKSDSSGNLRCYYDGEDVTHLVKISPASSGGKLTEELQHILPLVENMTVRSRPQSTQDEQEKDSAAGVDLVRSSASFTSYACADSRLSTQKTTQYVAQSNEQNKYGASINSLNYLDPTKENCAVFLDCMTNVDDVRGSPEGASVTDSFHMEDLPCITVSTSAENLLEKSRNAPENAEWRLGVMSRSLPTFPSDIEDMDSVMNLHNSILSLEKQITAAGWEKESSKSVEAFHDAWLEVPLPNNRYSASSSGEEDWHETASGYETPNLLYTEEKREDDALEHAEVLNNLGESIFIAPDCEYRAYNKAEATQADVWECGEMGVNNTHDFLPLNEETVFKELESNVIPHKSTRASLPVRLHDDFKALTSIHDLNNELIAAQYQCEPSSDERVQPTPTVMHRSTEASPFIICDIFNAFQSVDVSCEPVVALGEQISNQKVVTNPSTTQSLCKAYTESVCTALHCTGITTHVERAAERETTPIQNACSEEICIYSSKNLPAREHISCVRTAENLVENQVVLNSVDSSFGSCNKLKPCTAVRKYAATATMQAVTHVMPKSCSLTQTQTVTAHLNNIKELKGQARPILETEGQVLYRTKQVFTIDVFNCGELHKEGEICDEYTELHQCIRINVTRRATETRHPKTRYEHTQVFLPDVFNYLAAHEQKNEDISRAYKKVHYADIIETIQSVRPQVNVVYFQAGRVNNIEQMRLASTRVYHKPVFNWVYKHQAKTYEAKEAAKKPNKVNERREKMDSIKAIAEPVKQQKYRSVAEEAKAQIEAKIQKQIIKTVSPEDLKMKKASEEKEKALKLRQSLKMQSKETKQSGFFEKYQTREKHRPEEEALPIILTEHTQSLKHSTASSVTDQDKRPSTGITVEKYPRSHEVQEQHSSQGVTFEKPQHTTSKNIKGDSIMQTEVIIKHQPMYEGQDKQTTVTTPSNAKHLSKTETANNQDKINKDNNLSVQTAKPAKTATSQQKVNEYLSTNESGLHRAHRMAQSAPDLRRHLVKNASRSERRKHSPQTFISTSISQDIDKLLDFNEEEYNSSDDSASVTDSHSVISDTTNDSDSSASSIMKLSLYRPSSMFGDMQADTIHEDEVMETDLEWSYAKQDLFNTDLHKDDVNLMRWQSTDRLKALCKGIDLAQTTDDEMTSSLDRTARKVNREKVFRKEAKVHHRAKPWLNVVKAILGTKGQITINELLDICEKSKAHFTTRQDEEFQGFQSSDEMLSCMGVDVTKLADCSMQLIGQSSKQKPDYEVFADAESSVSFHLGAESPSHMSKNKNMQLSVKVQALIAKLCGCEGRDLRRALFSLEIIFQREEEVVHEFIARNGLECLIKVANSSEQGAQHHVLRALDQMMKCRDGMSAVSNTAAIKWLYSSVSSRYRQVAKMALKLLLLIAQFSGRSAELVQVTASAVEMERGKESLQSLFDILHKDKDDPELCLLAMTLINKVLAVVPLEGHSFARFHERQDIQTVIKQYSARRGNDIDLIAQFKLFKDLCKASKSSAKLQGNIHVAASSSQPLTHSSKQSKTVSQDHFSPTVGDMGKSDKKKLPNESTATDVQLHRQTSQESGYGTLKHEEGLAGEELSTAAAPQLSNNKRWMLYKMTKISDEERASQHQKLMEEIPGGSQILVSKNVSLASRAWEEKPPLSEKRMELASSSVSPGSKQVHSALTGGVAAMKDKLGKATTVVTSKAEPAKMETKMAVDTHSPWAGIESAARKRKLVIKDLDFTDLSDDEDVDIFKTLTQSFGPPPPPGAIPPPPPMMGPPGAAPPLPPPILIAPPPPAPLRLGPRQSMSANAKVDITVSKQKKTVRLHWKEVQDKVFIPNPTPKLEKQGTIWQQIEPAPLNTEKFEHLFESRLADNKAKDLEKQIECNKKIVIVLDSKRSNAINIGLTKLPPPRTIKAAILKMDSSIINREGIEKIMMTMIPTKEEQQLIAEAQIANPELPLGSAESLLLALSSINELERRLQLWVFKIDYEQNEKEIADPLADLKEGIRAVYNSKTFQHILATLLAIGNFLNGAHCPGFHIDYLSKVPEVKDTVNKHSLLYHLCTTMTEVYPDSTDLYSEISALARCSRVDWDELSEKLNRLEQDCLRAMTHLREVFKHEAASHSLRGKLAEFLTDCAERICVLKIIYQRMMNRYHKLLLYLGISVAECRELKIHQFSKVLSEFALDYRTTREKIIELQMKKAGAHKEHKRKSSHSQTSAHTMKKLDHGREVRHHEEQLTNLLSSSYHSDVSLNRKKKGYLGQPIRSSSRQSTDLEDSGGDDLESALQSISSPSITPRPRLERKRSQYKLIQSLKEVRKES